MKTGKLLHPDNGEILLNYCQNLHQWQKVKSDCVEWLYSKMDGNRFLKNVNERKVYFDFYFILFFLLKCVWLFKAFRTNGEVRMWVGSWFVFWFLVVLRTVCLLLDGKWRHVRWRLNNDKWESSLMHPHVFLINKSGLICPKQSQGGNNSFFLFM